MQHAQKWKYKNTALLALSLMALALVADSDVAHTLLSFIDGFGYLSALIVGAFFVSTFTVAPASVILFHLAQDCNPLLIALCAGGGGVVGDLLIFRFLRDRVFDELRPVLYHYGGATLRGLLHTPYFGWLAPVVGAIIIASPLPDEAGITLMGLSRIRLLHFVFLSFALNTLGIFLIVLAARSF